MDVLGLAELVEALVAELARWPVCCMPPNGPASLSVSGSLIQNVPAVMRSIAVIAHSMLLV